MTHPTDAVLFAATPLIPVPRFGTLAPLDRGAKRFLAGADGLYVQSSTEAMEVTMKLAPVKLPFGECCERIVLPNGPIPMALIKDFIRASRQSYPNEIAAAIVLGDAGHYELVWPEVQSASGGHVRYVDSVVNDDRLVVDLHSHGEHDAFFSRTDDESDCSRRGPYMAFVVGRLRSERPQVAVRLALAPYLAMDSIDRMISEGLIA
ncbi:PRTRC system protein A (plasmid) [Ahniella affigens]|uniref:PRTRC system protein A n=1 Tax=Ahniella affigens TaxID=2021234 RepID=A0A2P1PZI1_9GAMM|nr:PRTRC system protein A [Ahniella affigens]AVQ00248.1 PRTRC system protein A [Ahniella affigens]